MKELRTKIVVLFTFLMLVAAWGFWWLQTVLMQAGAIGAYPFIPVVFYFSGIVLVETLYRLDKTNPRKLVNVYMLLKLLKMVIAAIMALIYLLVLHAPLKPFIIVFAAFYMLYILFETYVFYSFEKQNKEGTQMNRSLKILLVLVGAFMLSFVSTRAVASTPDNKDLDVRAFILDHVSDSYQWHITTIGDRHISIPLPVIVYSKSTGWHVFLSSAFHGGQHDGFVIATEGVYKGKIVETGANGSQVKPFDISITKNVFSLLFSSLLLILIIMSVSRSYKKKGFAPKTGFVAMMEMFIMSINDDVIKPCIGKQYRKYAPYLLTVFFFVFINNLLGLIPIFPGGANVTGNIAITFVLAICTFLIVNIKGSKEYWKEILWPDVPLWLKFPVPFMPVIELVGIFTKPFALMIRLFANILAGHSIMLGLTALIFVTVSMGQAMNTSMTVLSVIFSVFISFVELLVAYIQAYIFTMLSAVFIGLARVEPHHVVNKSSTNPSK